MAVGSLAVLACGLVGAPRGAAVRAGSPRASVDSATVSLDTGLQMEYFYTPASRRSNVPPVVFVHGTFHSGWCWAEYWMEYFAKQGISSYAISLRGTAGSPVAQKSVKITEHAADLDAFVRTRLPADTPPILIGHSFGGSTVLKYLEAGHSASGAVLLCSVPPSGNGPMTMRFLRRSLRQAFLITRGLAAKTAASNADDARTLFFESTIPDERLQDFMPRFQADSRIALDIGHFTRNVPAKMSDRDGRASWLDLNMPRLVIGAEQDFIVDAEGVQEAAKFLNTHAQVLSNLPHDLMLCEDWKVAADEVIQWICKQDFKKRKQR